MNIQELKKEIGLTVTELKSRFTELASLNGATKSFWEKAKSLLDNQAKPTTPTNPTNPTNPSESTDLKAIVDHYGFAYVADVISWYEIEIGAKERSLANPKFWDKLQQSVNDGLFDDFSGQSIDKKEYPIETKAIVNNEVELELKSKNEGVKKPSAVQKNDKDFSIDTLPQKFKQEINGQYLLFDYWQCDVEYPVYEEIISTPIHQWPLNETLEKIKNLSRYWLLRLAAFLGVTSLDYCKDWTVTFIKDKILNAKVRFEMWGVV